MNNFSEKIKQVIKSSTLFYPLIIIIAIPALLIINTVWNLKTFNRDVNFLIRHEAVNMLDTVSPFISQNINDKEKLTEILTNITQKNTDFVSATVLVNTNGKNEVFATTNRDEGERVKEMALNQLAIGFDQPFAGLNYDPNLRKNVWNVVVPFEVESNKYLFTAKLKTDAVDDILGRTSKDSVIILSILVAVTLVLLTNHFLFYKKAIKAQELAEIDRMKDEFISMASHELRTPITAITGYLEIVQDKIPEELSPAVSSDFDILNSLTKDLDSLVNDLLDVSRLEQGRLKVVPQKVQINEIIRIVTESLTPAVRSKNLAIKFTPVDLPQVTTDPDRVRQILINLVNNSIKYTIAGEVIIETKLKDKFIEITVSDTGIGIPPEELPKLFTKFHRVKDRQTSEVRGTGLGLWITKHIVELLGGKIFAQSIYGKGSSFTFTLPLGN